MRPLVLAPSAEPAQTGAGPRLAAGRQTDWALILPAAVTAAVMLWGIGAPSYWRDEAVTLSAVSRSLPQLIRMLGHVDAVHGLYYLLLWPVAQVAGTGALAVRLPSALAMVAADVGVAAIAGRLCSRRAALCAGLVFAVLPTISVQGHNARPYAMVVAAAVWASYLLLRAVAAPRPGWFAAYGASLVLTGYLHLFALLLVPAHTITLMRLTGRAGHATGAAATGPSPGGQPRDTWRLLVARRWLVTVSAAALALVPVGVLGWLQRGQIGWIQKPGWHDLGSLVTSMALGPAVSVALTGLLAALACVLGAPPGAGGRGRALAWLAVPWLVLPPAVLLAVSEISPVYNFQYVAFCLPAVALLAGAGLAALRLPLLAAALALAVILAIPAQLAIRGPGSGGALRAAARVLAASQRPGDAIIFPGPSAYPGPSIPADNLAYPAGFARLRNIGLAVTAAAAGRLNGTAVPLTVLMRRECGVRRLWAVEMGPAWESPAEFVRPGFRLVHRWQPDGGAMRLWLYRRVRPCGALALRPQSESPITHAQPARPVAGRPMARRPTGAAR